MHGKRVWIWWIAFIKFLKSEGARIPSAGYLSRKGNKVRGNE